MALVVTPLVNNDSASSAARVECDLCPDRLIVRGLPLALVCRLTEAVERVHSCSVN